MTPKQREALELRYDKGMTFSKIAKELGCSTARANQIVHQAVRRVKYLYSQQYVRHGVNTEITADDSISSLGLSLTVQNRLIRGRIKTIQQLTEKTQDDLLSIRMFGHASLKEVREALLKRGLYLKDDKDTSQEERENAEQERREVVCVRGISIKENTLGLTDVQALLLLDCYATAACEGYGTLLDNVPEGLGDRDEEDEEIIYEKLGVLREDVGKFIDLYILE